MSAGKKGVSPAVAVIIIIIVLAIIVAIYYKASHKKVSVPSPGEMMQKYMVNMPGKAGPTPPTGQQPAGQPTPPGK